MPVNLAHLAHHLSQHLAVICGPVDLSLSSKLISPVESTETAVLPVITDAEIMKIKVFNFAICIFNLPS